MKTKMIRDGYKEDFEFQGNEERRKEYKQIEDNPKLIANNSQVEKTGKSEKIDK